MRTILAIALLAFSSMTSANFNADSVALEEDFYGYSFSNGKYIRIMTFFDFGKKEGRKCAKSDTPIVGFGNAVLRQDDCFFPMNSFDVAASLSIFYSFWVDGGFSYSKETEQQLLEDLRSLNIEFSSRQLTARNIFDVNGRRVSEAFLNGLTLGNGSGIWVYTRGQTDVKIHKTSFIHELVHVALCVENAYLHCDPDHTGAQYGGWTKRHTNFIEAMNSFLEALDL